MTDETVRSEAQEMVVREGAPIRQKLGFLVQIDVCEEGNDGEMDKLVSSEKRVVKAVNAEQAIEKAKHQWLITNGNAYADEPDRLRFIVSILA